MADPATTPATAVQSEPLNIESVTVSPTNAALALFTGSLAEADSPSVPNFKEINSNPKIVLEGKITKEQVAKAADADRENFLAGLPGKILNGKLARLDKGEVIDLTGLGTQKGIEELVGRSGITSHSLTLLKIEKQLDEAGLLNELVNPYQPLPLSTIVERIDLADGKKDDKLSIPELRDRMSQTQIIALQEVDIANSNLHGTAGAKEATKAKGKE